MARPERKLTIHTMTRLISPIRTPADVKYLAFQGGGGLGFTYLGAIEALEALQILPIRPGAPGQIVGVSGASAGAITALFLALGCGRSDFKELFSQKERFTAFYDGPNTGKCRGLLPQDYSAEISIPLADDTGKTTLNVVKSLYDLIVDYRTVRDEVLKQSIQANSKFGFVGPSLVLAVAVGYGPTFLEKRRTAIEGQFPFFKKIFDNPSAYLLNLTNDRGMFPGFPVRQFLQSTVRTFLKRIPSAKAVKGDLGKIDFSTLKQVTGIDLVVSGSNVSQRRSFLFSAKNTPRFPVVEAVGISACYPLVFKPVYIKAPESDPVLGKLRGLWVDGGLLNNFPIHAFDVADERSASPPPLNPSILGFTLNEGTPDSPASFEDPDSERSPLPSFAGGLLQTLLTPGNLGQLRSSREQLQMIPLYTFDLSLFEFAPSASQADQPLKRARTDVLRYFNR